MAGELKGQKIAVLATDGVEQVELTEPVKALKAAGAEVKVVSNKDDEIQGFKHRLRRRRPMTSMAWCCPEASSIPMLCGSCRKRSISSAILWTKKSRSPRSAMARGL